MIFVIHYNINGSLCIYTWFLTTKQIEILTKQDTQHASNKWKWNARKKCSKLPKDTNNNHEDSTYLNNKTTSNLFIKAKNSFII